MEILLQVTITDTQCIIRYFFFLSEYVSATANYIKWISYSKCQITAKYTQAQENTCIFLYSFVKRFCFFKQKYDHAMQ